MAENESWRDLRVAMERWTEVVTPMYHAMGEAMKRAGDVLTRSIEQQPTPSSSTFVMPTVMPGIVETATAIQPDSEASNEG